MDHRLHDTLMSGFALMFFQPPRAAAVSAGLEHNYGHGRQTVSKVFCRLNLRASVAHALLEKGDRLYQPCRAQELRRELWNALRTTLPRVLVESWPDLLLTSLADEGASP